MLESLLVAALAAVAASSDVVTGVMLVALLMELSVDERPAAAGGATGTAAGATAAAAGAAFVVSLPKKEGKGIFTASVAGRLAATFEAAWAAGAAAAKPCPTVFTISSANPNPPKPIPPIKGFAIIIQGPKGLLFFVIFPLIVRFDCCSFVRIKSSAAETVLNVSATTNKIARIVTNLQLV